MTLTRKDIEDILGPIGNDLATQIAAIGATPAELAQAFAWHSADDVLLDEGRPLPAGRVAELIGLLESAQLDEGEEL